MYNFTPEQLEQIGEVADSIDNLLGAMKLPLAPKFHLEQLREALPELSQRLKKVVIEVSGENPWEE